ncbi:DMT family transporter [Mucilaginibacter flavidus]|uniref:DMT family transporter n=1 Tax=Mucilaginibacter flavidus TaxID=2949309 RepID=UPI0020936E74|nr:DMT family transporter [Mucilaginibacter flavidus]MCO5947107.1 DMT family transporter [Mucilaginibacter flavidus]
MKKAFILLHLAVVLAGFTGVFGRLITLNAGLISWYRLMLSGLLLLLILTASGRLKKITFKNAVRIGSAGAFLGLHWVFFYASIKYSNISVGVVCFSLTSFFTSILAPLLNRKKFSLAELILSGLTLCGIGLIFGLDAHYRTGIILGVISSLLVAFYTIFNERLTKVFANETITLYTMFGGFAGVTLFLPVYLYLFSVKMELPSLPDFGYLLILALFCTVLLYLMSTYALKTISAFTVNLTFGLEPLYSIILAILIFKENRDLTVGFYCGLGLIILSVVLQMVRVAGHRRKRTISAD